MTLFQIVALICGLYLLYAIVDCVRAAIMLRRNLKDPPQSTWQQSPIKSHEDTKVLSGASSYNADKTMDETPTEIAECHLAIPHNNEEGQWQRKEIQDQHQDKQRALSGGRQITKSPNQEELVALSQYRIRGSSCILYIIHWLANQLKCRRTLICVAFLIYAVALFIMGSRTLRKKPLPGFTTMVGLQGQVVSQLAPEGVVRIEGELWNARAEKGTIEEGAEVIVVRQYGLKLVVHRKQPDNARK